jgi:transcriptional regulator with PAS, ATPase and Fis domain
MQQPWAPLIGTSRAIRTVQEDIGYAARSSAKVLLTGESGVGKEVVAHLIHSQSPRGRQPLVTVNCAGLPDSLLESELFGHVRGSFTGAYRDRVGHLEVADRGTILLDEVGEMSLRMQALLLRFLESGEIQRVGSDRPVARLDVRVIAATNRNLIERIAEHTFREDLYYRLNVVHIAIPPLRERRDDIVPLLEHFLRQYSEHHGVAAPGLTPGAVSALTSYAWPGNVRQLKNVAERLALRAHGALIDEAALPAEVLGTATGREARPVGARQRADALFEQLRAGGSFWTVVYPVFMARDITRDDLRRIVTRGLHETRGSYKALVQLFNLPARDYKRFLNFLRKHECHMPFQPFRGIEPNPQTEERKPQMA